MSRRGSNWGAFVHHTERLSTAATEELARELLRARGKFPTNRFLLAALMEEVGELAQALLQRQPRERIEREALQVAVVAMRIYEEGDATFADVSDEEAKP
jgi:NTP pyrophosphatase (non-canonical NTP hydrolase)